MDSIKIENLKCFKNTGEIPIKPMTIFVGQNSSGKSTCLRTFPLFRQSIQSKTRGPILWFGQYVDFGSFFDALRKEAQNQNGQISFTFNTHLSEETTRYSNILYFGHRVYRLKIKDNFLKTSVKFSIALDPKQKISYFSLIRISFSWGEFELRFNEKNELISLCINSEEYLSLFKNPIIAHNLDSYFPTLFINENDRAKQAEPSFTRVSWESPMMSFLTSLNHKRTTKNSLAGIVNRLVFSDRESFLSDIKKQASLLDLKVWESKVSTWTMDSPEFIRFYNLYFLSFIDNFIEMIDFEFCHTMENVHYIAPVRASAERYYRVQDLSVEEVDFQGKNLPMFIQALGSAGKKKFQDWVLEQFNFIPDVESEKGHLSLIIRTPGGDAFNVADKGFGFSQILPIITQLWSILFFNELSTSIRQRFFRRRTEIGKERLLVIEQPELHLHPALQGMLIDCMAIVLKQAKERKISIKIILETHSETIVNSLGHLIAEKKLSDEDVAVVIFGQSKVDDSVRIGSYDKDGFLSDWPIGFFSPTRG